jgi:hypothetical protein
MADTTDTTDTITHIVDTHLAGYCEADPERRRALLDQVWAADGELVDPPLEGRGPEAIAALVDAVLQHFPDHRFRRTSEVDVHHDHARYAWELVGPDGTVAVAGLDVATLDADGRLTRIIGFFGELPALATAA